MIAVVSNGDFIVYEEEMSKRILQLDDMKPLIWIDQKVIQSTDHYSPHKQILSSGKYRLYNVNDEPNLTDKYHLELCVGSKKWQSYLLQSNILKMKKSAIPIIPSEELISICASQCSNCDETSS